MGSLRTLLASVLVLAALAASAIAPPAALAQDGDVAADLRERVRLLRELPREEQLRLRAALEKFRSMPRAKREKLRQRARHVGSQRLKELAARDVKSLRSRHQAVLREKAAIVELLGPGRLDGLNADERRYIEAMSVRYFQRHVTRKLLEVRGPLEMEKYKSLPPHERRARVKAAFRAVERKLLAELPVEEQARIAALPGKLQKHERRKLVSEYRMRETVAFAQWFDAAQLTPFLQRDPAERARHVEKWAARARWWEMAQRLDRELGVPRDTLRLMTHLRADEWARIRDLYTSTEGQPVEERRMQLDGLIKEVHGQSSLDERRRRRSGDPRRMLRDEKRRRGDRRRRPGEEPR